MGISQVIGGAELTRKFKALGDAAASEKLLLATVAGALVVVNAAKMNIKEKNLIETRTLSRSIHVGGYGQKTPDFAPGKEYSDVGGAVTSATRAEVNVGTNVVYAAIHEYGGTIRPKNGQYLAIPVGSYKGSPRDPGLKLRKASGDTLVLVEWDGNIAFVLKKSVVIPAKPYLRPAFDDNQDQVEKTIGEAIKRLIDAVTSEK